MAANEGKVLVTLQEQGLDAIVVRLKNNAKPSILIQLNKNPIQKTTVN